MHKNIMFYEICILIEQVDNKTIKIQIRKMVNGYYVNHVNYVFISRITTDTNTKYRLTGWNKYFLGRRQNGDILLFNKLQ